MRNLDFLKLSRAVAIFGMTVSLSNCFDFTEIEEPDHTQDCSQRVSDLASCRDCFCYDEYRACMDDSDCSVLSVCMNNCEEDESCQNDCISAYMDGYDELVELGYCAMDYCDEYLPS